MALVGIRSPGDIDLFAVWQLQPDIDANETPRVVMLGCPLDDNPACNNAAKHTLKLRQMLADG